MDVDICKRPVVSYLLVDDQYCTIFATLVRVNDCRPGRVILYPNTNWSIAWLMTKPTSCFIILCGSVLQELAFEFLGQYGPRICALTGALFAANMLRQWLLARGTSQNASFLLSLVFLLDPLCSIIYNG